MHRPRSRKSWKQVAEVKECQQRTEAGRWKSLAGKGILADSKIEVLQNYYGLAIQENLDDVTKMAKTIETCLLHVASTDKNLQHNLCPDGPNS